MTSSILRHPLRQASLLGLAAAACLCAGSASAQSSPFFQILNLTNVNNGDPNGTGGTQEFPVTDDVTFSNLQLSETFKDGTNSLVSLGPLDTGKIELDSPVNLGAHGGFTSAILSGDFTFDGFPPSRTLDLTLQPTSDPASQYPQTVLSHFSALLGTTTPGVGMGSFSLVDGSNNVLFTGDIAAAPIPEASTVLSLGLMLALGLGSLLAARRRSALAK